MTTQNTILVTGGASGIGFAIVQAILREGWRVIVADVDAGNLDRALVPFEQLDVTDEDAVVRAIARCEAEVGPLTGVVITMTQVMAVELAPAGIRVNAIAPGPIETPLVREMHTAEARADWLSKVPQHRYGTPEEIAGAAIFLLDDRKSSFVTGQTLC